ncbi:MAG: hypothetical protein BJ554DRAFT_6351, partial [Olpidium bornovanus]
MAEKPRTNRIPGPAGAGGASRGRGGGLAGLPAKSGGLPSDRPAVPRIQDTPPFGADSGPARERAGRSSAGSSGKGLAGQKMTPGDVPSEAERAEVTDTLGTPGGFARRHSSLARGSHSSLEHRSEVSTIPPIAEQGQPQPSSGGETLQDAFGESSNQAIRKARQIQDAEIVNGVRRVRRESSRPGSSSRVYPETRSYVISSDDELLHSGATSPRKLSIDADPLPLQQVTAQPMNLTKESTIDEFRAYTNALQHPAVFLNLHNSKALAAQFSEFSQLRNETLAALAELEASHEEASTWKDNFLRENVPSHIKLSLTLLFSRIFRSKSTLHEPVFELLKQVG